MQKIFIIIFVCIFCFSSFALAAGKEAAASNASSKKIVKWVDSKGVTQYGDKLPAHEAGRNNAEMNNQGMILKRNIKVNHQTEIVDQQKLEQERKDKVLLASYTNAEEIDLARDRNLQMDQAAVQALSQQKISTTNRIARNNKTAQGFIARKKPIPAYLSEELRLSKLEAASIDKQLAQRKLNMKAKNARYAQAKARFITLKQAVNSPDNVTVNP